MIIRYDRSALFAGIGMVPWVRLGLEQWFDDYRIISVYDWDGGDIADAPKIVAARPEGYMPRTLTSKEFVSSDWYQNTVRERFAGFKLIPRKPLPFVPAGNDYVQTHDAKFTKRYENKAELRVIFGDRLPFPEFKIVSHEELDPSEQAYAVWQAWQPQFVLQHEQTSGGRGTYLIRTYDDYKWACSRLRDGRIVASKLVDGGRERSVQVCVTKYGTFAGSLQKQVIREPLLTNTKLAMVDAFCGAEVGTVSDENLNRQAREYAKIIGDAMGAEGYKGIFGIDFLEQAGELYILEVNARITGVTPVHSWQAYFADVTPFYLLHILELSGIDYEIDDVKLDAQSPPGAMLLLHHTGDSPARLGKQLASGSYDFDGQNLTLVRHDYRPRQEDADTKRLFIQQYVPSDTVHKPNARVSTIFVQGLVLDDSEQLTDHAKSIVQAVKNAMELTPVSSE